MPRHEIVFLTTVNGMSAFFQCANGIHSCNTHHKHRMSISLQCTVDMCIPRSPALQHWWYASHVHSPPLSEQTSMCSLNHFSSPLCRPSLRTGNAVCLSLLFLLMLLLLILLLLVLLLSCRPLLAGHQEYCRRPRPITDHCSHPCVISQNLTSGNYSHTLCIIHHNDNQCPSVRRAIGSTACSYNSQITPQIGTRSCNVPQYLDSILHAKCQNVNPKPSPNALKT